MNSEFNNQDPWYRGYLDYLHPNPHPHGSREYKEWEAGKAARLEENAAVDRWNNFVEQPLTNEQLTERVKELESTCENLEQRLSYLEELFRNHLSSQ